MPSNKKRILDDIFRTTPPLVSEDDCAENIVAPLLLRLGFERGQIRRKVTIKGPSGQAFKKQADIVVMIGESAGLVIETKKIQHKLQDEDENQALSYAQLLNPPSPYAVLTNGRNWEVYQLLDDTIGDLDDFPEPDDVRVAASKVSGATITSERRQAAERVLVTLENRDQLENAFTRCRQFLAKEGMIAESAFDELTKVLVCKFNEEKRSAEGLGTYRFTSAWLEGEGALTGLKKLFAEARQSFHVFQPNTQIQIKSNETALAIVKALERFGFYGFKTPLGVAGGGGDLVGSVYETFLTGTLRGDLGQYLTPRQLIDFMTGIADIRVGEKVLDLACGSGGFLISAFLDVRKKVRTKKIDQEDKDLLIKSLVMNDLWGIEINSRLATLCRINMIIHGDGYEHIYEGDSIRDDIFENTDGMEIDLKDIESGDLPKFDVILMNPPFNLPYEDSSALNRYELGRGRSAQGSDYLMLERAIKLLKDDTGRLLIVMPHGVASGVSESDVRNYIKTNSEVAGCFSLPVGCFKPFGGSNARTCILFLTKSRKIKRRFLAQAENVGYDVTTKYYRELDDNDLPLILEEYWKTKAGRA
jgi:type I restriction enzyme M protein